jgi:hypothetical protein
MLLRLNANALHGQVAGAPLYGAPFSLPGKTFRLRP